MGELGYTFNGLNGKSKDDFGHGSAKYITYMNVYKNPIATLEELDLIEIDKSQNEIKKGDILFTTSSETPEEVGLSSVWMYEITNIYVNSFCFGFRLEQKISINYMAYMLRSNSIRNKITLLAQGISRYNISKKGMMNIEVFLPSYAEQTQIGNFFKQLDDTIALHQRELEKFKILKTSYLENIFLGKVSLFTAKNTITWEQRKLGTCGNIITGNTPSTKNKLNYTDNGLLWVTPTDIKSNITTKTANTLSEEGKKLARTLPKNSILVTCIASIGKNTLILEEASCNQQINALIPNNNHDPYFLLTYSFIWSEKMKLIAGAGTMDIVNKTQFSDILCAFPSLEEQTQIGNFFKQLDDTIALHQKELAKYQQIKTACLEKMFME